MPLNLMQVLRSKIIIKTIPDCPTYHSQIVSPKNLTCSTCNFQMWDDQEASEVPYTSVADPGGGCRGLAPLFFIGNLKFSYVKLTKMANNALAPSFSDEPAAGTPIFRTIFFNWSSNLEAKNLCQTSVLRSVIFPILFLFFSPMVTLCLLGGHFVSRFFSLTYTVKTGFEWGKQNNLEWLKFH